ncbi:MAG: hypothetical protein IPM54_03415 [Polyangiaceae bacterium]|nr:hypothetical protein [Polyangiaceae bacterium]
MRDVTALGGPGVSTQHLAESGLISVHITTLAKLARIFHVRVEEFFIRKDCEIDEVAAMIYRMTDKDLRELRQKLERKVVN